MNIWILDSESGVTLLFQAYQEILVNEDLVSGLLTALNQFTVIEFEQGIESIEMGGLRWVYVEYEDAKLLFIAADGKDVSAERIRAHLNIIKQEFISQYIESKRFIREEWDGNTEMFLAFKKVIDEYYHQWKQAESITTIAEFFDILGIFQQVLNIIMNIVSQINNNSKIFYKFEDLIDQLKKDPSFKKEPELQKIDFSQDTGFNIITINPNKCDMMIAERYLINLLTTTVRIMRNELGHKPSLNGYIDEKLFDYLLNNMVLLKELNLDEFLLKLFLLN